MYSLTECRLGRASSISGCYRLRMHRAVPRQRQEALAEEGHLTAEQVAIFHRMCDDPSPLQYLASRAGAAKSHILSLHLKLFLESNPTPDKIALFVTPKKPQ